MELKSVDHKTELALALHNMMHVWNQYSKSPFEHLCMSAGEDACEQLERFGLVEDGGWAAELTDKGKAFLDTDADNVQDLIDVLELK